MDNEVTYYKTWYKYPNTNPTMLENFDEHTSYEVCWHWNKGPNKNIQYIEDDCISFDPVSHCWLVLDYHEGMNPNDMLEINFEQSKNGYHPIVTAWSEITYPKFNDN